MHKQRIELKEGCPFRSARVKAQIRGHLVEPALTNGASEKLKHCEILLWMTPCNRWINQNRVSAAGSNKTFPFHKSPWINRGVVRSRCHAAESRPTANFGCPGILVEASRSEGQEKLRFNSGLPPELRECRITCIVLRKAANEVVSAVAPGVSRREHSTQEGGRIWRPGFNELHENHARLACTKSPCCLGTRTPACRSAERPSASASAIVVYRLYDFGQNQRLEGQCGRSGKFRKRTRGCSALAGLPGRGSARQDLIG